MKEQTVPAALGSAAAGGFVMLMYLFFFPRCSHALNRFLLIGTIYI